MITVWVEILGWVTLIFLCGSGTMKIQEDHKLSSGSGRGTWVPPTDPLKDYLLAPLALNIVYFSLCWSKNFRASLYSAFLPSACGQVMFSQARVKNSVHRGVCIPEALGRGDVCPSAPKTDIPLGRRPPPGGHSERYASYWTPPVECILASFMFNYFVD